MAPSRSVPEPLAIICNAGSPASGFTSTIKAEGGLVAVTVQESSLEGIDRPAAFVATTRYTQLSPTVTFVSL